MMLVSALEALIEQRERSPRALAQVRELEALCRASDLDQLERDALVGLLQNAKRESIGRAGLRLIEPFNDREYGGLPAKKFFSECYRMRSALVHGHTSRPTEQQVRVAGANLENLVGHVIAGRSLFNAVFEPPQTQ